MILKRSITLIVLLFLCIVPLFTSQTPEIRIMVINSYYPGYQRCDTLVGGIKQWYQESPETSIFCEYLDWFHFNRADVEKQQAELLYTRHHAIKYSSIIVCDSNAFDFVTNYRDRIFPNTPVIYCGSHSVQDTENPDFHAIEIKDAVESMITWSAKWKPQATSYMVISDQTTAGDTELVTVRKLIAKYLVNHDYREYIGATPDELIDALNLYGQDAIVLALNYQYDRSGNRISPEDLKRIRTLSNVPIFTTQQYLIGTLAIGGYIEDAAEIGKAAAKKASHVIYGYSAEKIEPVEAKPIFVSDLLETYDLSRIDLPAHVELIKHQETMLDFYRDYASVSLYLFIIMLIALIGTILLLFSRRRNMLILSDKERQLKLVLNSSQIRLYRWIRSEDALVFDDPSVRRIIVDSSIRVFKKQHWKTVLDADSYKEVMHQYDLMEIREIDSFDIEVRLKVTKGNFEWFRLVAKVTDVDRHGNVLQVHGLIMNINARKNSQEELSQAHAMIETAIEQSPAGIIMAQGKDVKITTVNSAAAKIRGLAPSELSEIPLEEHFMKWQVYHEDGSPCKPEDLPLSRAMLTGHTTNNMNLIIRDINGFDHWIMVNATPIRNSFGEISAAVAIFLDVTEIRQYQQKLSENEERYHMIFDNSPLGIFHYNTKGTIIEVNEKIAEFFDLEKEDLVGQNMLTISQDETVLESIRASLSGKAGYFEGDYQTILKNVRIPIRVFFSPIFDPDGNQVGGLGIAEDMSDWRRAEQALVQSEEKFRILSEKSIAGINISQDGVFKYVNPRMTELFGYTEEEMLDMPIHKIIFPDDMDHVRQNILRRMHGDTDTVVYEFRGVKKSGEIIHIQTFGSVINFRGQLAAFGTLIDITERKRGEVERIRLEKAIDQTSEAIFITDTYGTIQYVNPAFEKLNGYMRYEVIGRNADILKGDDDENPDYHELWDTLRNSETWRGTLSNRRKNGTNYHAEATFSPIRDNNGLISQFIIVLKDVTDRVRIEKQLRQSQKMEAIGTLAGGIAHDFNNILGAILGYTELVIDDSLQHSRIHKNMLEVMSAATRAKELVAQILAFSRQKEQEKKPVNVLHIVKEVLRLLRSSTPSTIELKRSFDATSPIVMADPTQIHQVVMNLCTNASQAMLERGGILDIRVSELEFAEPFFARTELKPGRYVCLAVGDTGSGIPQEIVERIFEPYFTTKKQEGGTGLGLAIVHGIVRNLEGDIVVTSEESIGTEFVVYLPLIEQKSTVSEPTNEPLPHGKETIIFVDDEDMLIDFAQQAFERLGYDIHTFKDPREALKYYNRNKDRIDLIITDQTMPKMTGAQLATAVLHENPEMPIILCTGYSETISKERALQMGIREYVMKPLIMKEMAFIVRGILDDIS